MQAGVTPQMTLSKAMWGAIGLATLAACSVMPHRIAPSVVVIPPPADLPASAPVASEVAAAEVPTGVPASERPQPPTPEDLRAQPTPPASDKLPQAEAQPVAAAVAPVAASAPVPAPASVPPPASAPPPAAAPAAPSRQVLYFKPDAYKLDAVDLPRLEAHAQRLKAAPGLHLVIQAYADWRGDKDYNLALSKKRAQTVARQLVAMGAPPGQIEIVYHGERRGQQEGRSERDVAADRRVELSYR
jgi:outer membrane protein OmpA-like peptidoglycan-associated protein